jgi:hypothetical protein
MTHPLHEVNNYNNWGTVQPRFRTYMKSPNVEFEDLFVSTPSTKVGSQVDDRWILVSDHGSIQDWSPIFSGSRDPCPGCCHCWRCRRWRRCCGVGRCWQSWLDVPALENNPSDIFLGLGPVQWRQRSSCKLKVTIVIEHCYPHSNRIPFYTYVNYSYIFQLIRIKSF